MMAGNCPMRQVRQETPMLFKNLFHSLYSFKAWSQTELYALLGKEAARLPDDARREVMRLLSHIHVIDQIFKGHLENTPHGFKSPNTAEIPPLDVLRPKVVEIDQWYVDYVSSLPADRYGERIGFVFTDDQRGSMSREEILMHVLQHGGYHRGSIGRILVENGIAPPRETFTRFLHEQEPQRRKHG